VAGGERRFVSADDLTATHRAAPDEDAAFAALERAYGVAGALRDDAGLEPGRALSAARAGELAERLAGHDALAERVGKTRAEWVVTHGEPHGGNMIRDPTGGLHLIDWDTALVAPRERDLQIVLDEELTGWDEYRAAAGPVELDLDALGLYRRLWALADIASFTAVLRRPHADTTDMRHAYEALRHYLG
jgi:spectinomycin phosphotransferase